MTLSFESHLDALAEELERTVDALEGVPPTAPVPTCPGWSALDLSEHLRRVYAHWRANLAGRRPEVPSPSEGSPAGDGAPVPGASGAPGGPEVGDGASRVAAMHEEGSALLVELAAAGPEAPCWNWSRADETGAWVARRMALETAVHRVDAELCVGAARPVEAELAADGIEERIDVHLRCDVPDAPGASLGGTLCLVSSDLDVAFVVEVGGGRLRWRRGRGPADAALVGTASQLFLFTWNRQPLERLSLTGRSEVAAAWSTLPS